MGVLLLVAVVIGALVTTQLGGQIADAAKAAVCRIAGGDCESEDARAERTGEPALVDCIRSSSKRGINGAVKIAVVKFGGGVEGILEVRADHTARVLINGNAKAGLEFAPPTAEVDAGNTEAGAGQREFGVSGKGEYGRAWTFNNEGEAKQFIDDVKKKVTAMADPRPNLPFTDDDADIDLPDHDETTYAGGVEVRGKGELGSGTGLEGNLEVGGGAVFNEDSDSPDYGDKTYFFKVNGSVAGQGKAPIFNLGASGKGETRVAITYDRSGAMKSMRVIGQLDVTATANLKASIEGKDLKQFVESAQKAKGGAQEQAGGRVIFDARLDLTDPANAAAAQAFIHQPGADSAVDLYDRFEADATVNARFYSLTSEKVDAGVDLGVFEVSGEYTSEDAALLDAYYRDRATGGFKQWEDCVRGQT